MKAVWCLVLNSSIALLFAACSKPSGFTVIESQNGELIYVFEDRVQGAVITQNAKAGMRPYLHPVLAPDRKGVLTEIHPSHHLHQTGIYWGLKRVNGRDYFTKLDEDYYKKVGSEVVDASGISVSWQTVYDLLDESGKSILRETRQWTLQKKEGAFLLDLDWQSEALADVMVEEFFVGGLFIRMPWYEGIKAKAVNANRDPVVDEKIRYRAKWTAVGMAIEGRQDWAHITVLDHPENAAHPVPWRVDRQLGLGPSRQILGDWKLEKGESTRERYRLVIFTGELDAEWLDDHWKAYSEK